MKNVRVAVVGLNFGAEFVPIYLHHPRVAGVAICDTDAKRLQRAGDRFHVERRYTSLEDVLAAPDIDAVHIATPVPLHAAQSRKVLLAGKHCACAVPAALMLGELHELVAAQRRSGKNYMMMETAVYTREFLYVQDLVRRGELGNITFLRGAHLQDLDGLPAWWHGFPPMKYSTHALGPLLALMRTRAVKVNCLGSGQLIEERQGTYGNPYPFETAIFRLAGTPAAAEVSRFLSQTARSYSESFAIYGDKRGFEWKQLSDDGHVMFTLSDPDQWGFRSVKAERFEAPDRPDLLPPEIARFTQRAPYDPADPEFKVGGGHHGSHPHLVHEFISSIVEERAPAVDVIAAAEWTVAGICAHDSAMADGASVQIPSFG